jgi:hypothetical protein
MPVGLFEASSRTYLTYHERELQTVAGTEREENLSDPNTIASHLPPQFSTLPIEEDIRSPPSEVHEETHLSSFDQFALAEDQRHDVYREPQRCTETGNAGLKEEVEKAVRIARNGNSALVR